MSEATKNWNTVEILRKAERSPNNYVKIDGVNIRGLQEIKIEFGISEPYPKITMILLAKELRTEVEGDVDEKKD